MESLSETKWDVVISGTGLRNSLLALALSRSHKKTLHVDENEYYGGDEAAFSLQEVDEWVEKNNTDSKTSFRNVSLWKAEENGSEKLSFSRAYTLTLSPQIVYTKSKLLSQLVSSKVYKQLEFQAVGNWWTYEAADGTLRRLPNGREDVFQDKSIDNRAKRSLMKFLKFVVDYENQTEIWQPYADSSLASFLSSQFQFPLNLQTVISALTLSLDSPEETPVSWAIPRIARHLTSIGVFGPGFGAVIPKWGGGAEIAQVACRAGAVGGGIYVLGTGITSSESIIDDEGQRVAISLSNGETVKAKYLVCSNYDETKTAPADAKSVSKIMAVVSSPMTSLFKSSIEGSPLAAVSVITFPPATLTGTTQINPVYIMAHSSETGECPNGQCVLYATTIHSAESRSCLDAALVEFLKAAENGEGKLLYKVCYDQQPPTTRHSSHTSAFSDLAFNDELLTDVEVEWRSIMQGQEHEVSFMQFDDRQGMENDNDDDNDNY